MQYISPIRVFITLCIRWLSLVVGSFPDYPLLSSSTYKLTHQYILKCYQYLNSILNIKQLTVIGDSAGATIALNTAQFLKSIGLNQPKECILLSPWLDLSLANPQIMQWSALFIATWDE